MFPDHKRGLSSLAYFVQYPAGPVNMWMTVRLMTNDNDGGKYKHGTGLSNTFQHICHRVKLLGKRAGSLSNTIANMNC